MTTIRPLEEERWHWDWGGARPRQALVDALAELLASRWPVDSNDIDATPLRNIPFMAYQEDALAWESGGTEGAQRGAVQLSREMNAKLGKEQAYYLLMDSVLSAGYHEYRPTNAKPDAPYTGVECYITVPVDRAADPEFVRVVTETAKAVWPYWLDVIAVHILTESAGQVYWYGASYGISFEGWPYGVIEGPMTTESTERVYLYGGSYGMLIEGWPEGR